MPILSGWLVALVVLFAFINAISATLSQRRKIAILEAKVGYLLQKTGVVFDSTEALAPDIRKAVADGKKIQAIKLYRDVTGRSLREAKAAVESIAKI